MIRKAFAALITWLCRHDGEAVYPLEERPLVTCSSVKVIDQDGLKVLVLSNSAAHYAIPLCTVHAHLVAVDLRRPVPRVRPPDVLAVVRVTSEVHREAGCKVDRMGAGTGADGHGRDARTVEVARRDVQQGETEGIVAMRTIWIVDEGTLSVSEAQEVYRKGSMTVFRRNGIESDTYTRNCRPTRKDAVAFAIQMAREEIVKGQEAQRALTLLMADVDAPGQVGQESCANCGWPGRGPLPENSDVVKYDSDGNALCPECGARADVYDWQPRIAGEADCEFRKMPATQSSPLVGNAYLHAFTPPEMSVDVLEVGPNGPRVARLQEGAPPIYDVPHDRPCPKSFVDPEAISFDPDPQDDDTDEHVVHGDPVGRVRIPCPDGLAGCEVLHLAPEEADSDEVHGEPVRATGGPA